MVLTEKKYTAEATAEGAGRNGRVVSHGDAALDLKLATPKALGGSGDGQNPEQLFAMGYASCFLGALQLVASKTGKKEAAQNAKIHTAVHLGSPEGFEGFGIGVDIKVEGLDDTELIKAAHEFCPYSRALRNGVIVNVSKA
ncbi:OsmC-like protein [Rickenella mellea]|uniref:OsmC-like protein n=1 Tax=Rickenella mellea TaxID=50990 RepID=A0A4Y7QFV1_9AGAM|nr:OsmC-like protein [Rickenella mellea]